MDDGAANRGVATAQRIVGKAERELVISVLGAETLPEHANMLDLTSLAVVVAGAGPQPRPATNRQPRPACATHGRRGLGYNAAARYKLQFNATRSSSGVDG